MYNRSMSYTQHLKECAKRKQRILMLLKRKSKSEVARMMGISRQRIQQIARTAA